ncbi:hypothetical protein B0H63DRAFT_446086 [Podospora didyma]|uniref:Uncharacterized protein n=1 Tax=Podospora didyma TaxID=330526 RepID=A0AAE0NY32_9PEZI|nr:hypothetical protein B0H63DRAFT_446086 [Podospora didyma]
MLLAFASRKYPSAARVGRLLARVRLPVRDPPRRPSLSSRASNCLIPTHNQPADIYVYQSFLRQSGCLSVELEDRWPARVQSLRRDLLRLFLLSHRNAQLAPSTPEQQMSLRRARGPLVRQDPVRGMGPPSPPMRAIEIAETKTPVRPVSHWKPVIEGFRQQKYDYVETLRGKRDPGHAAKKLEAEDLAQKHQLDVSQAIREKAERNARAQKAAALPKKVIAPRKITRSCSGDVVFSPRPRPIGNSPVVPGRRFASLDDLSLAKKSFGTPRRGVSDPLADSFFQPTPKR